VVKVFSKSLRVLNNFLDMAHSTELNNFSLWIYLSSSPDTCTSEQPHFDIVFFIAWERITFCPTIFFEI
jgi:hypothetical protein